VSMGRERQRTDHAVAAPRLGASAAAWGRHLATSGERSSRISLRSSRNVNTLKCCLHTNSIHVNTKNEFFGRRRDAMAKGGSSTVPRLLSASAGTAKLSKPEKKRLNTRYSRGEGNPSKGVAKPELKRKIKRQEAKIGEAERQAAQAEVLLPTEAGYLESEDPLERTSRVRQSQLATMVDVQTQAKAYDVKLEQLGPYRISFTGNGRRVLLGGRKGHIAVAQWEGGFRVLSEIQVRFCSCICSELAAERVPGNASAHQRTRAGAQRAVLTENRPDQRLQNGGTQRGGSWFQCHKYYLSIDRSIDRTIDRSIYIHIYYICIFYV